MNICARCDQPILHGEVYDRVDMHANSGGQFDVLRHLVCPGRTTDRAPAGSPRTGRAAPYTHVSSHILRCHWSTGIGSPVYSGQK
ncbi:hypothetical protein ACFVWE_19325 [Streptomyces albidoflavus]|uniref:Uncharacterized protein n=2 Tax=Streptomyces TaxID=1883 RepID=A0AB37XF00_9ACTN|nr:hypothetical protein [Streptomyces sp. SM17]AWL34162.1 hypothetical protein B9S66_19160 [Streptomyces sp. SM17]RZE41792.1 hypothetical protein C0Q91_11480 [Streptomyces albidoflavus]